MILIHHSHSPLAVAAEAISQWSSNTAAIHVTSMHPCLLLLPIHITWMGRSSKHGGWMGDSTFLLWR